MTEFTKDELNAPSWLDKGFFERCVRNYEHDPTIEVQKFIISPGTKPGEHFASVMFKIDVTYSSKKYRFDGKNIKLIMKTYPVEEGFKKDILTQSPAFQNEIRMYTKVLPEMERVLAHVGDNTKFAPPLVYESMDKEPLPVIVFVDISDQGFKIFDDVGINSMEVVEVIVGKLAKFHATSIYLQANGKRLDEFNINFLKKEFEKEGGGMFGAILKINIEFLSGLIKEWGPEWDFFHKKLNGKVAQMIQSSLAISQRKSTYKVLCHGDFHNKNIMQRNGCTKAEDLILIDHQFPHWASPAMDLYYVFNVLLHSDLDEAHRNDVILAYYREFSSTLKKVGYRGDIPTLLDLHVELVECAQTEFLQILTFVAPRFIDFSKIDMNKIMTEPAYMLKIAVQSSEYRQFLKFHLLRHFYLGTMNYD